MKTRRVVFAPEARDDLIDLYDWICAQSGSMAAMAFIGKLETFCLGFEVAGERGHRRDDIRAGLRIIGFSRRVTVAFAVEDGTVTFLRFFYAGKDWEADLT